MEPSSAGIDDLLVTTARFEDMGIAPAILAGLADMGFRHPTKIQHASVPALLTGRDLIGQARTGTGKTAAFGIPILQKLDAASRDVQALVLVPTRELCLQVAQEIADVGRHTGAHTLPVYGGASIEPQISRLKKGTHIVVGTPGRVMDHMRRRTLHLERLDFLVLDEADRMLDMGFIDDVHWILKRLNPDRPRQTMLFSATMPDEVVEISREFLHDPVRVSTVTEQLSVPEIEQVYYSVGRKNKLWALTRVIDVEKPNLMLVFCATKRMVDLLASELSRLGYPAEATHGDLTQARRERVMAGFREGKVNILVATDVAARGLDIDDISHVVNYDLPEEPEVYVHRIGRTGRAGKSGKAISFVSKYDHRQLELVAMVAGTKIRLEEPPEPAGGRDRVQRVIDWDQISDRYGNVHCRIPVGKRDGVTMVGVHRMVQQAAKVPDYLIGNITVADDHTVFEVPKDRAMSTKHGVEHSTWKGKRLTLEFLPQVHVEGEDEAHHVYE